ncbi:MAG: peptidyl-prolyl cis-trans isomerase [Nitrospiria bacterium]
MKFLVLYLMTCVVFSGCWKKEVDPRHATLAEVNGEIITVGELMALMPEDDAEGVEGDERTEASEIEALKQGLLDQLVDRKMLLQEARRLNITLTETEMKNQMTPLLEGADEATFFQRLADAHIPREAWEKATRENFLIQKLLDQLARERDENALKVSEETVRDYYENNREQWRIEDQIKMRQIIVVNEEKAMALRSDILNGADFIKTARTHAMQTHTEDNEGMGYVTRAEVPVQFAPLFELDIGSVSEVIKTSFGYHLVFIEDKREAQILPFEEIREKLYQQLLDQKRERTFSKWIEKLRSRTEVRINEELLKSFS